MEIDSSLIALYRHWPKQALYQPQNTLSSAPWTSSLMSQIQSFASQRMHIWQRKTLQQSPPYSDDPILANFRFCNIYRELDKQTIAIHQALNPYREDFELWLLNLAFSRFVCQPQTISQVGMLTFSTNHNQDICDRLLRLSRPKYGHAYVFPISTIQKSRYPTRELFFTNYLPQIIPQVAKKIQRLQDASVVEALSAVLPTFGYNMKFHWTEILIDVAYQFPHHLNLFKSFPIGPGSHPTLKQLSAANPQDTVVQLANTLLPDFPYVIVEGQTIFLSAENWEGIGCEFRKYQHLQQGNGRRRLYRPSSNDKHNTKAF